jgi:transcriptional regulator with XRE-family HTH domain
MQPIVRIRLKEILQERNMSQQQLAQLTGQTFAFPADRRFNNVLGKIPCSVPLTLQKRQLHVMPLYAQV